MPRRRALLGGAMALLGANGGRAISAWERRKALEAKLPAVPQPVRIERYMKRMPAERHHAGPAAGRRVAGYALSLFKKFGFVDTD